MAKEREPSWKKMYDAQQQSKRDRVLALMKDHPVYWRPKRDKSLIPGAFEGKIAIIDERTGDMLVSHSADRETKAITYAFRTRSGELVSFYHTQLIIGHPDKIGFVPYRLYAITYNQTPSEEGLKARNRISPQRFAEFLASDYDYVDNPEIKFAVVQAPLGERERLL